MPSNSLANGASIASRIPATEYSLIIQTSSSAETTVASLNERERWYLSLQKTLHKNAKRVYPFWKVCQRCSAPFMAKTKEQATRNLMCGPACVNATIGEKNTGPKPGPKKVAEVPCVVCGKMVSKPLAWMKRTTTTTCSKQCNGALRGAEWGLHAHKARAAWSAESEAALKERMTGPTNPAWKGGVTYRNKKGYYAAARLKYLRCPAAFLPMARKDGYIVEYRLVMAQHLQRNLTRAETVHHIDHDPMNNALENLMLFATNADHKKYEAGQAIQPLWQPSPPLPTKE